MTELRVPFNRVVPAAREIEYVMQALDRGHIAGSGPFTRACETRLEHEVSAPRVLLTTSCTHALEMAALLLNIVPGDEIIVPAFTFVSTVNAFVLRGATPVFVDIRDDTLNIDERLIAAAITDRTKAIVVVHYAGVGCEMDIIGAIAAEYGLPVVEDNAHGLFGKYRSKPLGTFGRLATLSFHETKNVSCGEGGALIVNDPSLIDRAEILREKGTDRSRFLRGEIDKYTWVDVGSSYVPSDLLAAFLLGQLEASEAVQRARREVFARYEMALGPWSRRNSVKTLSAPAYCEQPYHMYFMRLPTRAARDRFIEVLREAGILAVFHYVPLHLSTMGCRYGYRRGDLPVTENASDQLVRLPFFPALSEQDQTLVVDAINAMDITTLAGHRG
jgi:dTDP-4-amino-4,6-dideoxygalactose transaminase